jgi:hypothetical protein
MEVFNMNFWLGIFIKYTGFRGLCSYSLTGRAVLQGFDLEMCQWKNSLPGLDDGKILAGNPYIYFYICRFKLWSLESLLNQSIDSDEKNG